ncbi:MAG: hypothetical protein D3904_11305 [Candidatus Electrothrix sp. EH2]|nr:hypothetical protein [Candidatus Electrothrix sp. EH2]
MIQRITVRSIFRELFNLIPVALIWLSAFCIYIASLAVNYYIREGGGAPSASAALLISTSKLYSPYLVALLFTVLLIAGRIQYPKYLGAIQVSTLSFMLLYVSFAVLAMMTALMCMCCDWQQW